MIVLVSRSISKSGIQKRIATLSTAAEDNCTTRMLLAVAAHCSKSDPLLQDQWRKSSVQSSAAIIHLKA